MCWCVCMCVWGVWWLGEGHWWLWRNRWLKGLWLMFGSCLRRPLFRSLSRSVVLCVVLRFSVPGWGAGLTSAQLVITAFVARLMPAVSRVPPVPSISGIGLTVACCWGIHVGLLGWLLRGDERWGPMLAHSAFGVFSVVLVFPHLRRFRRIV